MLNDVVGYRSKYVVDKELMSLIPLVDDLGVTGIVAGGAAGGIALLTLLRRLIGILSTEKLNNTKIDAEINIIEELRTDVANLRTQMRENEESHRREIESIKRQHLEETMRVQKQLAVVIQTNERIRASAAKAHRHLKEGDSCDENYSENLSKLLVDIMGQV